MRAIFFLTLVLMIPVFVAVNPVDPAWQPGWCDDGDTDQLVTQTMSPESMIGLAVLALACFSPSAGLLAMSVADRGLGGRSTFAQAINQRGEIVGTSDLPGQAGNHAVIWRLHDALNEDD
jgi:hypothetical protein